MKIAGRVFGYARGSLLVENVPSQVRALEKAGCRYVYREDRPLGEIPLPESRRRQRRFKDSRRDRPVLGVLLEELQPGDALVVWRLDRLGRSLTDLAAIARYLRDNDVVLTSIEEDIDTSTDNGHLIFDIISSVASFENGRIREHTRIGMAKAEAVDTKIGRPSTLSPEDYDALVEAIRNGERVEVVARKFGVAVRTVYRLTEKTR